MKVDKQKAHNIAMKEIKEKYFKQEVERQKGLILNKKTFWQKVMPFKIIIKRR